jgi:hypothetical protein
VVYDAGQRNTSGTNEMTKEEQTVILAALLHGVERLFKRVEPKISQAAKTASPIGAGFFAAWRDEFAHCVDDDLLQMLVQNQYDDKSSIDVARGDPSIDPHIRALMRLIN